MRNLLRIWPGRRADSPRILEAGAWHETCLMVGMKTTLKDASKSADMLLTIETAIIAKMAKSTGYAPFQMKSMIKRIPELREYYKQVRAEVIASMAQ